MAGPHTAQLPPSESQTKNGRDEGHTSPPAVYQLPSSRYGDPTTKTRAPPHSSTSHSQHLDWPSATETTKSSTISFSVYLCLHRRQFQPHHTQLPASASKLDPIHTKAVRTRTRNSATSIDSHIANSRVLPAILQNLKYRNSPWHRSNKSPSTAYTSRAATFRSVISQPSLPRLGQPESKPRVSSGNYQACKEREDITILWNRLRGKRNCHQGFGSLRSSLARTSSRKRPSITRVRLQTKHTNRNPPTPANARRNETLTHSTGFEKEISCLGCFVYQLRQPTWNVARCSTFHFQSVVIAAHLRSRTAPYIIYRPVYPTADRPPAIRRPTNLRLFLVDQSIRPGVFIYHHVPVPFPNGEPQETERQPSSVRSPKQQQRLPTARPQTTTRHQQRRCCC